MNTENDEIEEEIDEEKEKLKDLINNIKKTFNEVNIEPEESDSARSIRG